MRKRRDGKKWMAIKLDLKKAYEKVGWEFIGTSLQVAGVLKFVRSIIIEAIIEVQAFSRNQVRMSIIALPFCSMYGMVRPHYSCED